VLEVSWFLHINHHKTYKTFNERYAYRNTSSTLKKRKKNPHNKEDSKRRASGHPNETIKLHWKLTSKQ